MPTYEEPYRCTREAPWSPEKGPHVIHEDAHETGDERDFGLGCYCIRMECPHCGHRWWEELPQ